MDYSYEYFIKKAPWDPKLICRASNFTDKKYVYERWPLFRQETIETNLQDKAWQVVIYKIENWLKIQIPIEVIKGKIYVRNLINSIFAQKGKFGRNLAFEIADLAFFLKELEGNTSKNEMTILMKTRMVMNQIA